MRRVWYRFPHGRDSEGYPNIERLMTPQQYELYSSAKKELEESIRENAKEVCMLKGKVAIESERLPFIWQCSDKYMAIPYPANGYECRTVATSGIFPIVMYMALKYFNVDVTLEDLVRIALWGDWHHANGTWHHYIDVVGEAYGMDVTRVSSLPQVIEAMKVNCLAIAMLDNSAFYGAVGNVLVVITEITDYGVYFYYPGDGAFRLVEAKTFLEHAKMFWVINPD